MAARKKLLSLETMNPAVREVQVPILGSVSARALEIQKEIDQGAQKPFGKVTGCHFGDLQAGGQKPLTFLRQVVALCTCPDLLDSEHFPEDAKQRARDIRKTLDGGSVGSYNPSYITNTLPRKIARFIQRRDGGVASHPGNIVVAGGASQAILGVMSLVVNPEDPLRTGVLVPVPAYPLYKDAIAALLSAVPVTYLLDEENNWAVNVAGVQESLHAARKYCHPKVMCIINPGNPTGHVMSRDSMEEIIKLAVQEKLLLLADEVYQDNVFAPGVAFHSFKKVLFEMGPEFSERLQLASINSISKGSTECGLRSGYVEFVNVDPAVFKFLYILKPFNVPSIIGLVAMETLVEPPRPEEPSYQTFFAVSVVGQPISECGLRSGYVEFVNVDPAVFRYLFSMKSFDVPCTTGVVALEVLMEPLQAGEPSYQTLQSERRHLLDKLWKKAQLAEEMLNAGPGIRCNPIQAALYAFPRIHIPEGAVTRAQGRGLAPDVFFCHLLLEESGIVLSDGGSFGQEEGTYHVRISLLQPLEELRCILGRIVDFHRRFVLEYS